MVSTRGRYALRVMIDLAENDTGGYIPMKEVASRQNISLKYMEKVLPLLVAKGLVEGIHGKGGGYRLTRQPAGYSVNEILRATDDAMIPVACMQCTDEVCSRKEECRTLPMWTELGNRINAYLDSVTLDSLMKK